MKKIFFVILFVTTIIIFHNFFLSISPIMGGDYTYLTNERLNYFQHFSFSSWYPYQNIGLSYLGLLNYAPYSWIIGMIGSLGVTSVLLERIVWWIPYFLLSGWSIYFLSKTYANSRFAPLAIIMYVCNTYALLIVAGGQVQGIGIAYALAPLQIVLLQKIFANNQNLQRQLRLSLLSGLILAIQMVFDIRIVYVTLVACFIYGIIYLGSMLVSVQHWNSLIRNILFLYVLPLVVLFVLHAFWIMPLALSHQNPLDQYGSAYTTIDAVRYFSFTNFEDSVGLLHPNWPENIFGLTHFMRPEFLLLPLLAFGSLFFIKTKNKENKEGKDIIYFVLLGLIGIFLAKGANDPFGGIYLWMFGHVPGFEMFRDPTKWYLLIAMSYAVLIPYTVSKIYDILKEKFS